MTPAGIAEIDETAATGAGLGAMVAEDEMDALQPIRATTHPFGDQVVRVREELGLPNSQSVREVVSLICAHVGRLSVVEKDQLKAQAEHIGKLVADDRKFQQDPQLWDGPAAKVAEHVLNMRLKGEAILANSAEADGAT